MIKVETDKLNTTRLVLVLTTCLRCSMVASLAFSRKNFLEIMIHSAPLDTTLKLSACSGNTDLVKPCNISFVHVYKLIKAI